MNGCSVFIIGNFSGNSAVFNKYDSVTDSHKFFQIRAEYKNGRTFQDQIIKHIVDIYFGRDINTLGGFIKNKNTGGGHKPAHNDQLLLFAAGQMIRDILRTKIHIQFMNIFIITLIF